MIEGSLEHTKGWSREVLFISHRSTVQSQVFSSRITQRPEFWKHLTHLKIARLHKVLPSKCLYPWSEGFWSWNFMKSISHISHLFLDMHSTLRRIIEIWKLACDLIWNSADKIIRFFFMSEIQIRLNPLEFHGENLLHHLSLWN